MSRGAPLERALVLALSRRSLDAGRIARVRELAAARPSWPLVVEMARTEGVLPLVQLHLAALDPPGVPIEAREALAAGARRNAARNALFARELASVLERLAAAGVPAIALKGVALAESLYGDINLRMCGDLDVLVPRAMGGRALRVLAGAGYERAPVEPPADTCDDSVLLESNMEYGLVGPHPFRCPVEIHWEFAWRWPGARQAAAAAWADARPSAFRGLATLALSPEWELLYLAVHAARHRWSRLKWLVDVHERCAAGDLDWDRVGRMAAEYGWRRILALTLGACRAFLGTGLPRHVWLEPPPWLVPASASTREIDMWEAAVFPARLFDGLGDRLGYVARLLFRPTLADHRSLPVPARLRALHRGWRPVRLGAKGAAQLVSGLTRIGASATSGSNAGAATPGASG